MNPHKVVAITLLLVCLSFAFGFHNYKEAEQSIVDDLNQALRQSVKANMQCWFCQDSIQTYAKLQKIMGTPIVISSANHGFTEALRIKKIKSLAGIMIHVLKEKEQENITKQIPADYLTSDTLVWLSPTTNIASSELILSLQGYAQCSIATIFALSDQKLATTLLFIAIVISIYYFYSRRKKQGTVPTADKKLINFGNLTLCCNKNYFLDEQQEKLKLTPMQYSLMEMFYLTSSHQLPKADICEALWPGKENADETLYTLIRRLKPVIEECSNLKITTDRGKAYTLELKA